MPSSCKNMVSSHPKSSQISYLQLGKSNSNCTQFCVVDSYGLVLWRWGFTSPVGHGNSLMEWKLVKLLVKYFTLKTPLRLLVGQFWLEDAWLTNLNYSLKLWSPFVISFSKEVYGNYFNISISTTRQSSRQRWLLHNES